MAAPEVIGGFLNQGPDLLNQFIIEKMTGLERIVAQQALTKTVNGVNGGTVEIDQGILNSSAGHRRIEPLAPIDGKRGRNARPALESLPGLAQPLADAALQLLGGGFGVGHDQNLVDRKCLFDDQPHKNARDGVGFTCAGTGFDQIGALQRGAVNLKRGHGVTGDTLGSCDRRKRAPQPPPDTTQAEFGC